MLTVEIKVNGSIVAVAHAVNRGGEVFGRCEYDWTSAVFPTRLDGPPETCSGRLTHDRVDGCVELTRLLCEAHRKNGERKK